MSNLFKYLKESDHKNYNENLKSFSAYNITYPKSDDPLDRDVSFQAVTWIQAFMKSNFLHFYLFSARFGGF